MFLRNTVFGACLSLVTFHTASSQCLFEPDEVTPFCTEENDWGITYAATVEKKVLFENAIGCIPEGWCFSVSWFIMQIDEPGDLAIQMTHSEGSDLDFICLGPFTGKNKSDVLSYVCDNQQSLFYEAPVYTKTNTLLEQMNENGCTSEPKEDSNPVSYDINNPCFRGYYDEFPINKIADCSSSHYSTELCYLPQAKTGEWYLVLISNWGLKEGTINFKKTSGSATTHCDIIIDAYTTGPYCEGETIQLGVNNVPEKATFLWTGPNGFTSTDKNPAIPNATKKNEGEYKVVMYNNGFETPEVTVEVDIFKKDTTTIKESVKLEADETFNFDGKEYSKSGSYTSLYENANGCDSLVVLDLKIENQVADSILPEDTARAEEKELIRPKTHFSPNSDGIEEYWAIENIELYPDARIRIFDRRGKLLYETKGYDNSTNTWDGTYKGTKCPSDDYWFVIDIESLDKQYKGHFTLIRSNPE